MKQSLKIFIKIYMLFLIGALHGSTTPVAIPTPGGNPPGGYLYQDEFGPLQSNYSMGDFVRYTVAQATTISFPGNTPNQISPNGGLNVYYQCVNIPYAQDIYKYNTNSYNLYNFVGYLYAGYAALNINPSLVTTSNWLNFRKTGNGSLGLFDNNQKGVATIQLVDYSTTSPYAYLQIAAGGGFGFDRQPGDVDAWYGFGNMNIAYHQYAYFIANQIDQATDSCTWNTNYQSHNFVLAMPASAIVPSNSNPLIPTNNRPNCAAPYGQFFGARLSHILGAVVNDVPLSTNVITNMPTGTPVPQMAVFSGGPAAYAGATTPSTAHFGSLQNYLTNVSSSSSLVESVIKKSNRFSYLVNHLLPTVKRFATGGIPGAGTAGTSTTTPLCSYQISLTSDERNLIAINSGAVTAYDNGVIVDVQNNTGDQLTVMQVTGSSTSPVKNPIGTLNQGSNNYFLHTASLMNLPTASTATLPVQTNMIEIKDTSISSTTSNMPSVFICVVTAAQAAIILSTVNTALGVLSPAVGTPGTAGYTSAAALQYNGGSSATSSSAAQYLLVTNFNPNTAINNNLIADYRLQAIDVSQFNGQPYFVTLQVSKENVGYGLNSNVTPVVIDLGSVGFSMLKCSMVSVKICLWSNPYATAQSLQGSQIPLLLIPDSVLNLQATDSSSGKTYKLSGLQAHYGIWLMAYACALTEFDFGCTFGDNIECIGNTFGLFDVVHQSAPARVVMDANGCLASGKPLVLQIPQSLIQSAQSPQQLDQNQQVQSTAQYIALMGSDVWDGGMNQDIPILNLYKNANGKIVANQFGGANINFAVNFASNAAATGIAPTTFAQGYGQPYANSMLYSLPTTNITSGVIGQLTQPTAGNYQLIWTDQSNPVNVLAFQKVFLNQPTNSISINFLNSEQDPVWGSSVTLPASVASVGVGQTASFVLTYEGLAQSNTLYVSELAAYQAQMQAQLTVSSKLTKISRAVGLAAITATTSLKLDQLPNNPKLGKQSISKFALQNFFQQIFANAQINVVLHAATSQQGHSGFVVESGGLIKHLTLDNFKQGFYIVPVFESNGTVLNLLNNSNAALVTQCVVYLVDAAGKVLGQNTVPISQHGIDLHHSVQIAAGSNLLQYSIVPEQQNPGQPLSPVDYDITYPGAFFVKYQGPLPKIVG